MNLLSKLSMGDGRGKVSEKMNLKFSTSDLLDYSVLRELIPGTCDISDT